MKRKFQGALYLSTAAAIWGGMYVASKYTLAVVPPFTLLLIRYAVGAAILVALCRLRGIAVLASKSRSLLFQIGFIGYFVSIAAQFIGTKLSSAHMGAVITSLSPLFQSAFAVILLRAGMSVRQLTAAIFSFAGVMIITGTSDNQNEGIWSAGNLFLLAAAAAWGYYSILVKRISASEPALQTTAGGILISTLFCLPFALFELPDWQLAVLSNPCILASILYLSVLSTVVAYFCWNKGLAMTDPHQAGIFFFLQPIVGSLLGWLLLDETLSMAFIAGSLMILASVYFVMRDAAKG